MDHPKIPMSHDEFNTIEHILGWKTEYWNGHMHLTPRQMGIQTCLNFDNISLLKDSVNPQFIFIEPSVENTQSMIDGYIDAFINSVEFCGWPIDRIFEEAHNDISLFFQNKRGKALPASVIVLEPETKQLIGTALVTDKPKKGACLGLLYLRPSHQRRGLGTDIIHHCVRSLTQQGYKQITSRYHICNHHSRQFYHKLGFKDDVCDRYHLSIYTAWLRNNIRRQEKLKMPNGLEEMKEEQEQLQAKLDELEETYQKEIRGLIATKEETG